MNIEKQPDPRLSVAAQVCLLELGLVLLSHHPPANCATPKAHANPDLIYDTGCLSEWVRAVAEGRVRAVLTSQNRENLKHLYKNLNGIL